MRDLKKKCVHYGFLHCLETDVTARLRVGRAGIHVYHLGCTAKENNIKNNIVA